MNIEITKMTSKGQVVIPQNIRERKEIEEGEKFIVYDTNDSIVLKRVKNFEHIKSVKHLEKTFSSMWKTTKLKKITEKDVESEIILHRKEKYAKNSP